jgi:hypothetical protein
METILYFVGAGLTKSLELSTNYLEPPTHPVPLMFDFVSTASAYLDDEVVLTTLADLETAEPPLYAWKSPEARALAQKLVEQGNSEHLRTQFAQALRNRPSESIEDLLCNTRDGSITEFRFKYAIQRIFWLIGWNVDWHPLDSFLRGQFEIPACTHTFVSYNYDLMLDRAIEGCTDRGLDLSAIYGFQPAGVVFSDPGKSSYAPQLREVPVRTPTEPHVSLLKPHGSFNCGQGFFRLRRHPILSGTIRPSSYQLQKRAGSGMLRQQSYTLAFNAPTGGPSRLPRSSCHPVLQRSLHESSS